MQLGMVGLGRMGQNMVWRLAKAGHEVSIIDASKLEFPLLRSKEEFENGVPADSIRQAQETIHRAEHLVIHADQLALDVAERVILGLGALAHLLQLFR